MDLTIVTLGKCYDKKVKNKYNLQNYCNLQIVSIFQVFIKTMRDSIGLQSIYTATVLF